VQIFLLRA
jgi:pyruvate kinase